MSANFSQELIKLIISFKPEPEEPSPEPVQKKPVGETIKQVLSRFGVRVAEQDDVWSAILRLPEPFPVLIRAQATQWSKDPSQVDGTVQFIARMLGVSSECLTAEVKEALEAISQSAEVSPLENNVAASAEAAQVPEETAQVPEEAAQVSEAAPAPEVIEMVIPGIQRRTRRRGARGLQARCEGLRFHHATCDHCKTGIRGIRYKCTECPDFDLCSDCEAIHTATPIHKEDHVFAKLYNREGYHAVQKIINENHSCERGGMSVSPSRHQPTGAMPRVEALETQVKALQEMVRQLSTTNIEPAPVRRLPASFLLC